MSSPTVEDGTYVVLNLGNTSLALDSCGATDGNNANVQLFTRNDTDAQLLRVWTRADGTRQLCFAATGKCVDVANGRFAHGNNVQQYQANDTAAQQWIIQPVEGRTETYQGSSRQVYKIWCSSTYAASTRYLLEADGTGTPHSGQNLCISEDEGISTDQMWIFVPMEPIPVGTYVVRPKVDTSLAIDVDGSSHAAGANVMISGEHLGSGPDSGNNQVLLVREYAETGQAKLAFCHSMQLLEVANRLSSAVSGDNVVQSTDDGGTDQYWVVTPHGTATLNGTIMPCYTLHNVAASGATLCLDVCCGRTTPGTNLRLWEKNDTAAQDFLFEPAEATDAALPVPSLLGLRPAGSSRQPSASQPARGASSWEALWSCAGTSWQARYRYAARRVGRTMPAMGPWHSMADGSTANGGWGTTWRPNVTTEDLPTKVGPAMALPAVDNSTYDLVRVEVEVRRFSSGYGDLDGLYSHGHSRALVCSLAWTPTVTVSAVGWSPDGLVLSYASDWARGGNTITVLSATSTDRYGNVTQVLSQQYTATAMPGSGTLEVPISYLSAVPPDGDRVTVRLRVRTDSATVTIAASASMSWDQSHGISVVPAYMLTDRDTLLVTLPAHATDRVWMMTGDGMEECPQVSQAPGSRTFEVTPPLNEPFDVCMASRSGDLWGTNVDRVSGIDEPGYVWNWDDEELGARACVLHLGLGQAPTMSDTGQPQYERHITTGRQYPTYTFGETEVRDLTVSGVVLEDGERPWATREALEELKGAHHATFRDPRGGRHHVAVLEVSKPIGIRNRTEATVKQEEESL